MGGDAGKLSVQDLAMVSTRRHRPKAGTAHQDHKEQRRKGRGADNGKDSFHLRLKAPRRQDSSQ